MCSNISLLHYLGLLLNYISKEPFKFIYIVSSKAFKFVAIHLSIIFIIFQLHIKGCYLDVSLLTLFITIT